MSANDPKRTSLPHQHLEHGASNRGNLLAERSAPPALKLRRKRGQSGFRDISFNATATHCMHSNCTPGGVPARGSTHAGTIDHVHTGTTCFADLRDHAVRLLKR